MARLLIRGQDRLSFLLGSLWNAESNMFLNLAVTVNLGFCYKLEKKVTYFMLCLTVVI